MTNQADTINAVIDEIAAAARAIGKVSKNPDWQFAAKHWDRVNDDESKDQLMRMASAALQTVPRSPVYSGYSKHVDLGQWLFNSNKAYAGQVVVISNDGRTAGIVWYKKKSGASGYDYSRISLVEHHVTADLWGSLRFTKSEGQP